MATMVVLPVKFTYQRRVKLAQGLWLFSWLAAIGGAFTFALGVFLKTELNRRSEVMDNTDVHIVPNMLMIVGLASMGINIVAGRISQDALDHSRFPRWKNFLKPFFGVALFFTFITLLSVILSYAMKGSLEASLKIGLKNGIRFYKDTDVPGRCFQKQTIDRLQMEFQCCGNTDYKDWFEVQWISNRYLDFSSKEVKNRIRSNVDARYLLDGVPFSCCNPSSARPCIQYEITNNSAHYNYEHQTEDMNIHIRGCREALVNYYMDLMNTIGAGVLSVLLVQVSVLASLRYLQTALEKVVGQENAEMEAEGYLLERSVKETAKELMDTILKFLQLNQVAATEGQPAEGAAATPAPAK